MAAFKVWYSKNGKSRQSRNYYIDFKDHNEIRHRIPAYPDLKLTQELESKLAKLVAAAQLGDSPEPALVRWLESMPLKMRERLIKIGLIDTHRASAAKPVERHLEEWQRSLEDKGTTAKQARLVVGRARRVLVQANATKLSQIDGAGVQRAVASICESEGLGAQTFNFYLNAAKQFTRWLENEGRISHNPIRHLERRDVKTDRRHDRRALTPDECRALLQATASQAGESWGMTGPARALLYRLALETGLRSNELRSLTVADFTFKGSPVVRVRAAYAKNRRTDELPLRAETAALVKAWCKSKLPTAPVFENMPVSDYTAKMLRADLEAAGVPYKDADGRVADFHALRHTFVSSFANNGNVNLSVAQRLARHSTPILTARYTHVSAASERAALEALPDLDTPSEQGQEKA